MKKYRDKEKEIVQSVLDDFKMRQLERKHFENSWQLNINFFVGNQYSYISPSGDIMEYGKQYFWQEREVYNHIANLIETRLSKLSRVRPALTVVPFSDDEKDIASAKTSKKILKAVCSDLNLAKIISQATMWSEVCGTVFYKVDWDNSLGRVVGINELGQEIHEGDVSVSVVSPFEIYPDSNTYNSVEECASIIYARSFHKDAVKNIWGIDVEGQDIDIYTLDSIGTLGGLGYTTMSSSMAKKLKKDQVLVLEKYEKPTIEFPNGRLIVVAGDKIVFMGDLPYINASEKKRGFPFIRQISVPVPNSFWGMSIVDRCIPVQRSFNAIKNRKHEFLNRLTMGILSVEDGSLDIENLEEEGLSPGKILIHRQGSSAPKLLSTGNVPLDFQKEEDSLLNEFLEISGVGDLISTEYLSAGNVSGVALQLLMEHEDIRLATSADEIRNSAKDIAKQILRLYKQFAITSHSSRIVGDNGAYELFYWLGSDINAEDVVFETENEINTTLAQKRSMIFEILNAGLLNSEDGKLSNTMRTRILEQLGFGVWEGGKDLDALHKNSASKENLLLLQMSKITQPLEIDNHGIHIEEHIACMLSGDYERALKRDVGIEEMMLNHIREHKKFIETEKQIEYMEK